jgi:uncharacterized protein YraI
MAGNRHPQDLYAQRDGTDIGGDTGGSESAALSNELRDALELHLRRLELTFADPAEEPGDGHPVMPAANALLIPQGDHLHREEDDPDFDEAEWREEDEPFDEPLLVAADGHEGEELFAQAADDIDDYDYEEDDGDGLEEAEDDEVWVFDRVGLPPRRASDGRNAMPIGAPPLAPVEAPLPDWLVSRAEERLALEDAGGYEPHERWNAPPPAQASEERTGLLKPSLMILSGLLSVGVLGTAVMEFGLPGSPAPAAAVQEASASAQEMEPVHVATTRATTVISAPAQAPSAAPPAPAAATEQAASTAMPAEPTPSVAVARVFTPPTEKQNTDPVPPSETRIEERNVAADARETVAMVTPAGDQPAQKAAAAAPETPVAAAPPQQKVKVTSYVNMRSKPQSGSSTITVIPAGVSVDLYRCDRWCEVGYNGKRGWVYKTFVDGNPGNDKTASAKRPARPAATPAERVAAERNASENNVLPGGTGSTAAQAGQAAPAGSQDKWGWLQNWKFK